MMNISVLTPEKQLFEGHIESVKVPGVLGQFQVLKNHAPVVSALEAGTIYLVTEGGQHKYYDEESGTIKVAEEKGKEISYKISGGFIEVLNNEVALLIQGV
ncbi:MAG: hypothetical protein AAFO07_02305 [Bacteroidota bacterium]